MVHLVKLTQEKNIRHDCNFEKYIKFLMYLHLIFIVLMVSYNIYNLRKALQMREPKL